MNFSSVKVDNTSVNVSHFCHNCLTKLRHFATWNSLLISPAMPIINYGTLCTFVKRNRRFASSRDKFHTVQTCAFLRSRKLTQILLPVCYFARRRAVSKTNHWIRVVCCRVCPKVGTTVGAAARHLERRNRSSQSVSWAIVARGTDQPEDDANS